MRIRSKLLLLMVIPILAVIAAAGLGLRSRSNAAADASAATSSAKQAVSVRGALSAISVERLSDIGAPGLADPAELRSATDLALDELGELADRGAGAEFSRAVESARERVSEGRASPDIQSSIASYSAAFDAIRAIPSDASVTLPTNGTLTQHLANELLIAGAEDQARAWFAYLAIDDPATADTADIVGGFSLSQQSFTHSAGFSSNLMDRNVTSLDALARLEIIALDDLAEDKITFTDTDVLPELAAFSQEWATAVSERDSVLLADVSVETNQAREQQFLFALLAILGSLVLGGLVIATYRPINLRIAALLDRANAVANVELPQLVETLRHEDNTDNLPEVQPIAKDSDDEIGELIGAFNEVQETAYQLATEQAIGRRNISDTFVNFGRRNQLLLQRMLTVLTGLEQDEEDPDSLEALFHLDNIVTRMRRNAESLLILAGAQTTRQWTAPVDISDTVRSAFGEVEAYERIDIVALPDVKIRGGAVADIAHLLAELLENALNFSKSSTSVLVSGQFDKDGYLITIFDQGIGMSLEELEEANDRISNPPPLDRAPTRFLGLFVVGRLADRHSIKARLVEAPGRGLMARIHLPNEILASDEEVDYPQSTPIRSTTNEDTSPLETEHDIDAEWEGLTSDGLPVRDSGSSDSQVLPTRTPAAHPGVGEVAVVEAPRVEASKVDTAEAIEAEVLPTRTPVAAVTEAEPVEAEVAEVAIAEAEIAKVEVAEVVEPEATKVEAGETPDVVEDSEGIGEGLPTRHRGESLADNPVPEQSHSSAAEPTPGGASDFSSMMSALSSGISRGLEDKNDSDDEWSKE